MTVFQDYQVQIEAAVAAFKALPEAERERLMAEQRRIHGLSLWDEAKARNGLPMDTPPPAAPHSSLYGHRDPLEPTVELVDELTDDEPGRREPPPVNTAHFIARDQAVENRLAKVMMHLLVRAKHGPLSPHSDVFPGVQPDPGEMMDGALAAGASALAICAAHEINPLADSLYVDEKPDEWRVEDLGPWEFVDPREALYRAAVLIVHELVVMEGLRR